MTQKKRRRIERAWGIGTAVALLCLAGIVFVRNPARVPVTFCVLRAATGLYCPGCGGTTMVHLLLHGRFAQAFLMNPPLFILSPALAYIIAAEIIRLISGRYVLPALTPKPWAVISIAIALVLFGVLRNISAFSFLAPVY